MLTPCEMCRTFVAAGSTWTHRRSTGFGFHNEETTSHCSRECRATYAGQCVVCAVDTRQATLAAYAGGRVDLDHADAVAWGR